VEAWLRALISAIPFPFRPAGELVIGGIIRLFQWTNSLLGRVRSNWNPLSAAARWLSQGIDKLAIEAYLTFKHLILDRLPAWAQHAINTALRWAADRINAARALAQALFDSAITWARDRINDVRKFAQDALRWTTEWIAWLRDATVRLIRRVFEDWASPFRLAEWLVGAMWSALWRYAWGQRDRLVDAVKPIIVGLLLRAAHEIERQIARMF